MTPKISIIIPSYQGELYINRAIDSVLAQTYRDYEIVVIDDGSTDRTSEIMQAYQHYPHVHYFYKENGGLSDARNFGMQKAVGEYIYFLDSDDWIEDTYLEKMIACAEENNADIVLSTINMTDGQVTTKRSDCFLTNIKDMNVRNYYSPAHFHPIMQNKLFRKSLIKDLRFPVGLYYEDVYFFVKAFERASIVCRCPEAQFYYFQHEASIMKQTSKKLLDIEQIFLQLMEEDSYLKQEDWFEYLVVRHLFLASTRRALKAKDAKLRKIVVDSHAKFVETHFPHWQSNALFRNKAMYQGKGQQLYARIIRILGYKKGLGVVKYFL